MQNLLSTTATQTMSSLEIAKLTEKDHDKVLVDIRKMLDELEIGHAVFRGSYKSKQNKDLPCFNLPRRECDILVSGYSVKYRAAIVDRWLELEAVQPKLPTSYLEALTALVQSETEKQSLQLKIESDKPKVEFAEAVRNTDGKVSVGDFAKVIGTGQNRLFMLLRNDKFLMANNRPYQSAIDRGLLVSIEQTPHVDNNGVSHPSFKTLITGKGQVYFEKRYRVAKLEAVA